MAVYTDDFTGTANTDLDVYDSTWVDIGPNADTLKIDDYGTAVDHDTGTGGGGYLYNQTFNSKHYAELEILGDSNIGPLIRVAAGGNFYYCFAGTGGVYNGECVSGSIEDWDGGQSGISTNDVVALYVDATTETTILYKVNDSTIQTYTSKSSLSGGKPGIGLYDSGTGDNWEGGDVGAAPQTIVLDALTLTSSLESITIAGAAVSITINALTLVSSIESIIVIPTATSIVINELTITSSGEQLTVTPGIAIITLDELILVVLIQQLTVTPLEADEILMKFKLVRSNQIPIHQLQL